MENVKQNLKISGVGSTGGGVYDEVSISGSGKISGDIDCNIFKTSGSSEVIGNVKAKNISVSGSSSIDGNINSEDIKVSGSSVIKGELCSSHIKISGSTEVGGGVHCEDIKISGSIKIKNDCEAESFEAKGGFEINGLLNADSINIDLGGRCSVKEIGGEKINVREFGKGMFVINKFIHSIFGFSPVLNTEVIEGDDIYLEVTNAKIVRGNNITIGKGCNIDLVEYKNEINILEDGKVKEQRRI